MVKTELRFDAKYNGFHTHTIIFTLTSGRQVAFEVKDICFTHEKLLEKVHTSLAFAKTNKPTGYFLFGGKLINCQNVETVHIQGREIEWHQF